MDSLLKSVMTFSPVNPNAWNERLFEFRLDAEPRPPGVHSVSLLIKSIVEDKKEILGMSFVKFAENLKVEFSATTEIYGRDIIDVGFFSLPVELVNAVKKQIVQTEQGALYISWGGDYFGTKDYMHFELRPDGQRKFQIAMHQIATEEIRKYLNDFTDPNDAHYEY